jgi:hypothetical protein
MQWPLRHDARLPDWLQGEVLLELPAAALQSLAAPRFCERRHEHGCLFFCAARGELCACSGIVASKAPALRRRGKTRFPLGKAVAGLSVLGLLGALLVAIALPWGAAGPQLCRPMASSAWPSTSPMRKRRA